jgi:CheY-like chemotaxis protein
MRRMVKMHTRKARILIVEDDVQLRHLLCTILEQAGYMVRPAADGFAALEEMRTESPDVLLSDLYMPGMSGFELLAIVRHHFPATRLVAMSSAYSGEDLPNEIVADAFYPKATDIAGLLQIMEAMTGLERTRVGFPN